MQNRKLQKLELIACTKCRVPEGKCERNRLALSIQNVRIENIAKLRKGKKRDYVFRGWTIIHGIPIRIAICVLPVLKHYCSCGGYVKDGAIVLQGDQRSGAKEVMQPLVKSVVVNEKPIIT